MARSEKLGKDELRDAVEKPSGWSLENDIAD